MNVAKMLEIDGSREWKKGNYHRIYFGLLIYLFGFDNNLYSTAYPQDLIPECPATKDEILLGKFWYDVNTKEFKSKDLYNESKEFLIDKVLRRLDGDNEKTSSKKD